MPYIVGTAGHIDHGKTTLVKVLTGQDTDRLKEEKERGISIELGFAHLSLPDGTEAGVIDVPGHERFVRNMLAGAHGIDLVLFTVAADDGVMPQTEEHFDIVRLLGVRQGIFVISKADLASPERIEEVKDEIRLLAADTAFSDAPIQPFSAMTRAGLPELISAIQKGLKACEQGTPSGYFRMPVDRAFTLQGHGLVVTGTAQSGSIDAQQHVRCLPGGEVFRVRSVQVHGSAHKTAGWGQRVALNLAGSETASVKRGQVVCHEKIARASDRFDAWAEFPRAGTRGVRSHQLVRVHIGTAECSGKIVFLHGKDQLTGKEGAFCQITLDEPTLVMRGDRFIVRDEAARRTLGGGEVLHPWAPRHKLRDTHRMQKLETLREGDFAALVDLLLADSDTTALPLATVCQFFNITEQEAAKRLAPLKQALRLNVEGEQLYLSRERWEALGARALALLGAFHQAQPLASGMDQEELRAKLKLKAEAQVYRALLDHLVNTKSIAREGNLTRLASHSVRLGGAEKALMEKITASLGREPLAPPDLATLEKDCAVPKPKLIETLRLMEKDGSVVRVSQDFYFLKSAVDGVRNALGEHLEKHTTITAAAFRDLIGSTRKYIIPFLEYFDRSGFTLRVGDNRKLKSPRRP